MKTYPYMDGDQLIELVEQREYDEILKLALQLANRRAGELEQAAKQELQEAVTRMEAVPVQELYKIWDDAPGGSALDGFEAVRARLIQAVKGEQP
jgi:hypothetical protein